MDTTGNPVLTRFFRAHLDSLEQAGRLIDKHMAQDSNFYRLAQLMHLGPQSKL